jgi:hypothetical protein
MRLGRVRNIAVAAVILGTLCVVVMAESCGTDAQANARDLDALVVKSRSAETTVDYRVAWSDGTPEGTLVTYNDKAQRTRVDLTYHRPDGATSRRTLLLDGSDIYYCASDNAVATRKVIRKATA